MGLGTASSRTAGTTPVSQNAGPLFSTLVNATATATATSTTSTTTASPSTLSTPESSNAPFNVPLQPFGGNTSYTASRPRPATSAGEASRTRSPSSFSTVSSSTSSPFQPYAQPPPPLPALPALPPIPPGGSERHKPNVLTKERRPSLSKKPSFTRSRGSTSTTSTATPNGSGGSGVGSLFHHQRHKSSGSIFLSSNSSGSPKKGSTADDSNNAVEARPPLPSDWIAATSSATRRPSPNINNLVLPGSATTSPDKTWSTFTAARSTSSAATTIVPSTPTTATFTPNFSHPSLSSTTTSKMLATVIPPPTSAGLGLGIPLGTNGSTVTQSEGATLLQHIHELVNKRISTLDYLRKAHEGRVYWFNTLRFERPDIARMSYFDSRRLARRATNYLLLGLSLPAVVDLNSTTVIELLRSLSALFAEFETFQQLHSETGSGGTASSLSRAARLPNMFRRAPGAKVRRTSSSAASGSNDFGSNFDGGSGGANGGISGGAAGPPPTSSHGGGADSFGGSALTLVNSESAGSVSGGGSFNGSAAPPPLPGSVGAVGGVGSGGIGSSSMGGTVASTAFATYYDNNTDLLPGEGYTFLLTPSLPFDPDFFETFATLCDVIIDSYQRILSLMPTSRDCTPVVVELFSKTDARVRKLLVQGVVKEFEDHSRAGVKMEVANVGKVVLGGLM
ncbi:hypothetical protein SEUCBS140593_006458 [Sporothrix eucalyptigena]|uniref:Uncharacterized protein n=1 Tax=Sporothrix eucalyptigena TaxID=1812306 RepID=A0ABP0C4W5_9PEZI